MAVEGRPKGEWQRSGLGYSGGHPLHAERVSAWGIPCQAAAGTRQVTVE